MVYLTEQPTRNAPALLATARGVTPKELASMFDDSTFSPKPIPYGYCQCGCGQRTSVPVKSNAGKGIKRGVPLRFVRGHHRAVIAVTPRWNNDLACYELPLVDGSVVLVDAQDIDRVIQFNWSPKEGHATKYATRHPRKGEQGPASILMHRFILGVDGDVLVDHINGNGLDNRQHNLRTASVAQNQWNLRGPQVNSSTKYLGVRDGRSGKWEARITVNRKSISLGRFACPIEAAIARDVAALQLHGEFATLNFSELREVMA